MFAALSNGVSTRCWVDLAWWCLCRRVEGYTFYSMHAETICDRDDTRSRWRVWGEPVGPWLGIFRCWRRLLDFDRPHDRGAPEQNHVPTSGMLGRPIYDGVQRSLSTGELEFPVRQELGDRLGGDIVQVDVVGQDGASDLGHEPSHEQPLRGQVARFVCEGIIGC
jgi:hypothetical protein